ncbi:DUF6907 domain-containing protein [Streptomyces sp. NPDC004838]
MSVRTQECARLASPALTAPGSVRVPCSRYAWCGDCRLGRDDDGQTYLMHDSHRVHAPIPAGLDVERGELLSANVGLDDTAIGVRPQLYIGHAGDCTEMTPTEARVWLAGMRATLDGIEQLVDQIDRTATATEIGAQFAARVAAEVPTLAEKISPDGLAAIMTGIVALAAGEAA